MARMSEQMSRDDTSPERGDLIERNCSCWKCSWGFCHFCEENVNTVLPIKGGYRYKDDCGTRTLKVGAERLIVSVCAPHLQEGRRS